MLSHITIQVHIALDEQTEENGCLQYIPGSHRYSVVWFCNYYPYSMLIAPLCVLQQLTSMF